MDVTKSKSDALPSELWRLVFTFLAIVWTAGGKRERSDGQDMGNSPLGWVTAAHVCQAWRNILLGYSRLWAEAMCAFADIDVIYDFKSRSKNSPFTLDVDLLIAGSLSRDISTLIDRIWGDWEIFEGCRVIKCTLGLDNAVSMRSDYSSNGTLGTDAWMRLFLHQHQFPALTSLTFPWTYQTIDLPDIKADNLTYLRVVGVRVVPSDALVGYRSQPQCNEDVGDLDDLIKFLQPLGQLKTLIVDRGSFEISPAQTPAPTSFPTLVDMHITSDNAPAICQMQSYILTPLEWDIATSAQRGAQLLSSVQSNGRDYDLATIDQCAAWTFITFSSYSTSDHSATPRSLLDPKFMREAWFDKKINLHVTRDHITLAFSALVTPHFIFTSTCRRLVVNNLEGPKSSKVRNSTRRRMRKDWEYLSGLAAMEHVWLNDDCPMIDILSKLQSPKRVTLTCVELPDTAQLAESIAPVFERWLESGQSTPSITLKSTLHGDLPLTLESN